MGDAALGITVVMPALGRVEIVRRAVAALRQARDALPAGVGSEFYLVDDSPEPDASRLKAVCDPDRDEFYLRGPRVVSAKRNLGVHSGRYRYVLFLDSDCFPQPSMLVDHLELLERGQTDLGRPIGAVTGGTVLEGAAKTWFWRVGEFSQIFNAPYLWPLEYCEVPWSAGANLSMPRSVFAEVNGFDENPFTVVGGEDVDICVRLRDRGYVIACVQKPLVHHSRDTVSGLGDIARKLQLYGRSSVYNAARQPHHQELYANRVAISVAVLVLAVVVGVPLSATAPALVVAVVAVVAMFVADAIRLMRLRRRLAPQFAIPAVTLEWVFDLGICREALRRGRIRCLFSRFRYFDRTGFRRLDAAAGGG